MFLVIFIALSIFGFSVARFLFGGNEDTWICTGGSWVKHGYPLAPPPAEGCEEQKINLQTFNEAGLSLDLEIPSDMTFRKEIAEDAGRVRAASFYVEKGPSDNPTYQLYAVYQPLDAVTEKELDRIKTGMSPNTIKEATVGGYLGIEGLIEISGPKNHFTTAIIKDGRLFTISTYPPTEESKLITDWIISTIKFK